MRIRQLCVVSILPLLLAGASCASTRNAAGECKEYKPLAACSLEFKYVCETTEDGCEQCGCVPRGGRGDGIGPARPNDR